MRVYLKHIEALIPPIGRKPSEIELAGRSVKERLKKQFKNYQIADYQADRIEYPCLIIEDHSFLSDLAAHSICTKVNSSMESFEVLSIRDHQSAITSGKGEQYPVGVKFYKTPSDKLERFVLGEQQEFLIDTRLPAHIYNQSELCVPVQPFFGIALTNWSEVLAAASLLSRQELGQTVVMLRKFCSDAMIKRLFNIAFIAKLGNKIGKNCNIHPTAHVEGSVIGDNVEIGPYCYVRSSYIEDNVTIREHSSIKVSYLSAGAFTMPCDMFNAFVGRGSVIFTSILHNSYFGHDSFIGGASGFSDFDFYNKNVPLSGLNQDSNHRFLGSAVGDNCRIGAGIVFKSGLMIPSGTTILNHEMIKEVPVEEEQFYIKNKDKLLRVPEQFITGKKS